MISDYKSSWWANLLCSRRRIKGQYLVVKIGRLPHKSSKPTVALSSLFHDNKRILFRDLWFHRYLSTQIKIWSNQSETRWRLYAAWLTPQGLKNVSWSYAWQLTVSIEGEKIQFVLRKTNVEGQDSVSKDNWSTIKTSNSELSKLKEQHIVKTKGLLQILIDSACFHCDQVRTSM